jgi:hypothetical protein
MYRTRHFAIQELVFPAFHAAHRHRGDIMFMVFDRRALVTLDRLRERYGKAVVNDWHWGGSFELSGLRPPDSGVGAALSQHIFGRAFDCKFQGVTAEEIRSEALASKRGQGSAFEHVARIEAFPGMAWFHFDVGNADPERIVVVTPSRVQ